MADADAPALGWCFGLSGLSWLALRASLGQAFAFQDRSEGASCPIGPRFSSLKIALGECLPSAAKCPDKPKHQPKASTLARGWGRRGRGGGRLFWSDSK